METTAQHRQKAPLWHGIARVMLALFNPMMMVVLMSFFVMCGWASPLSFPPTLARFVMLTVVCMVVLIPLISNSLMRLLNIGGRDERGGRRRTRIMFLVVALCCACCGSIYRDVVVLFLMCKILYTASFLTIVLWVFELIFPLSKNSFGAGALLAMMWMLLYVGNVALFVPFMVVVLLAGLLATLHIAHSGTPMWREMLSIAVGFAFGSVLFVVV